MAEFKMNLGQSGNYITVDEGSFVAFIWNMKGTKILGSMTTSQVRKLLASMRSLNEGGGREMD